jgi:hypothetical protein
MWRPWETVEVGGAGDAAVGPRAGGRRLGEALEHLLRQCARAGSGERGVPLRLRDTLRSERLLQVEPGDLRGQGIEDLLVRVGDLSEGPHELVATAVRATDRAEAWITGAVLNHPVEVADEVDEFLDVTAFEGRVLDAGLAAVALAEATLVKRQHAIVGVEIGLDL